MNPDRKLHRKFFRRATTSMLLGHRKAKVFRVSLKGMVLAAAGRHMARCFTERRDPLAPVRIQRVYLKARRWAAIWVMSAKPFKLFRSGKCVLIEIYYY